MKTFGTFERPVGTLSLAPRLSWVTVLLRDDSFRRVSCQRADVGLAHRRIVAGGCITVLPAQRVSAVNAEFYSPLDWTPNDLARIARKIDPLVPIDPGIVLAVKILRDL